eukprot:gb/GECH01011415.1/.p1 GENE.gb/GECH01011415.1/~~gb/GECH01011415.1/.p1  ORF type:complete len:297 (+),score=76.12 gb/GECH01011415.1/:1-891(+)
MSANAERARELVQKADKKLKSWFSFGDAKWEDASEIYQKATNLFKTGKYWDEAAESAKKEAQCHMKLDSKYDAALCYADAAISMQKADNGDDSLLYLQESVDIFTELGRFSTAAKHLKEIAEHYENSEDLERAVDNYRQAADLYSTDNSNSHASQCLLKVAVLQGQAENYQEAIEVFEKIASDALDNNLLRFRAKDYLFQAFLCRMAAMKNIDEELDDVRDALQRYLDMDVNFPGTREASLASSLLDAMENGSLEAFTNALRDYDRITRLDNWKSSMLLKAKQLLESDAEDLGELQ